MVKKIKIVYELIYVKVIGIDCFFAEIFCYNVIFFQKSVFLTF